MDLQRFVNDVIEADGVSPFNEATMLAPHEREAVKIEVDDELAGLALGHTLSDGKFEVEFAVHPKHRRQGIGSRLIRQLQDRQPLVFWAHGNTEGAQAFARRYELNPVRTLYVFELPLLREIPDTTVPEGMTLRTFDIERDAERWVELNSRVFADHPEQGSVSREDFDARVEQEWFDPEDFLVLEDESGEMIAYNWLKRADGEAEIYVLGVSPDHGGRGLGTLLMNVALGYFKSLGYEKAILYVDDSNVAAVNLYRGLGFTERFVDVQYK